MFVVQMRHKGKRHEVWDETVPLETEWDAKNHIEIDRSGISENQQRYEYRIVKIIEDFK